MYKRQLGDWGIEQNRGESRENIETAYLYRDLILLAETAGRAGRTQEQQEQLKRAQEVLEEYNKELLLWNPQTGEWAYDSYDKAGFTVTQATQAIPLQFGMVPVSYTHLEVYKRQGQGRRWNWKNLSPLAKRNWMKG